MSGMSIGTHLRILDFRRMKTVFAVKSDDIRVCRAMRFNLFKLLTRIPRVESRKN